MYQTRIKPKIKNVLVATYAIEATHVDGKTDSSGPSGGKEEINRLNREINRLVERAADWETKYNVLAEEKAELEEQENDSRLQAQR